MQDFDRLTSLMCQSDVVSVAFSPFLTLRATGRVPAGRVVEAGLTWPGNAESDVFVAMQVVFGNVPKIEGRLADLVASVHSVIGRGGIEDWRADAVSCLCALALVRSDANARISACTIEGTAFLLGFAEGSRLSASGDDVSGEAWAVSMLLEDGSAAPLFVRLTAEGSQVRLFQTALMPTEWEGPFPSLRRPDPG